MGTQRNGTVVGLNGNLVTVDFEDRVIQGEVAFVCHGEERLKSEVIRVQGKRADLQIYEDTSGITVGERVEFTDELLSVKLGPGMLGQVFDGLQNPLPKLAEEHGFFLKRGVYLDPSPRPSGKATRSAPGINWERFRKKYSTTPSWCRLI